MKNYTRIGFSLALLFSTTTQATTYYVATTGNNSTGNGSSATPWETISHAMNMVSDGDTILVKPGTYFGMVDLGGTFAGQGVVVKSEVDYMAKLRNNDRVLKFYESVGVTVEGFDIAHDGPGASALVIHIDGYGDGSTHDITLYNNIIHDSYNNDLAKINNACYNILVKGNLFFNQEGSDEHIDGNSVQNLTIEDNIFMSDFVSSGRAGDVGTVSSHIVIKDSNGNSDQYLGSENVTIRRNVFLSYEGNTGTALIQFGEDGTSNFEAKNCLVENNLLLGNSTTPMRASFQIKGVTDITFRNNTIQGNLPSNAYIMRAIAEGSNPACENILLYNNIWSDTTGTMVDIFDVENASDLNTATFEMDNNLFWNNGSAIPSTGTDIISVLDDASAINGNPQLGSLTGIVPPYWNGASFDDNSTSIREAFESLVSLYGTPTAGSPAIDAADATNAPNEDILGHLRTNHDIGAVEFGATVEVKKTPVDLLQIYPNPTNGPIRITGLEKPTFVQIYAMDGTVCFHTITSGALDINSLAAGIYILNIDVSTPVFTRIIKYD